MSNVCSSLSLDLEQSVKIEMRNVSVNSCHDEAHTENIPTTKTKRMHYGMQYTSYPHLIQRVYILCESCTSFLRKIVLCCHRNLPSCRKYPSNWTTYSLFHQAYVTKCHLWLLNTLSCGRCDCKLKCVNFKHNLGIDILSVQIKVTLEWMSHYHVHDKSTLFQLINWLRYGTCVSPVLC